MGEGKDSKGFVWVLDRRFDDFYYLQDFEHVTVMKVTNFSEHFLPEHWEATIYEDASCQKVLGREEFPTEKEAKSFLEEYVQKILKNKK
jgi:hypothetical protein